MLNDLHFGAGTFATWEKRGTVPNGEILSKIANYFNVSTDYLLGNEQIKSPDKTSELEKICMQLSEESIAKVLDFARYQSEQEQRK